MRLSVEVSETYASLIALSAPYLAFGMGVMVEVLIHVPLGRM